MGRRNGRGEGGRDGAWKIKGREDVGERIW